MTLTPYPRFGECIRFLAGGFDTKGSDRDVDRLARKGDFDWSLLDGVIEELLVEGTKAVMGPLVDSVLRPWLLNARDEYTQVVLSACLDSIGREQSLPVLMEHFFLPRGAELLRRLHDAQPGPELADLLDGGGHSPVDAVFNWLEKEISEPVGKLLYPASTDADKVSRDKISKWRNGTDIPSLQGIKLLLGSLINESQTKEYAETFASWLLIASALARFDQKFAKPIRPQILAAVPRPPDIAALASSLEVLVRQAGADWPEMADEGRRLWFDLHRTSAKNVGDQQGLWHRIEQIERLANQLDPAGMTAYHYAWMKGRWHVLSGQYDEAIPHYKLAFELAAYRAGSSVKDLVREGLCIAAFLGNEKPLVKQLKHVSVALGLFIRPESTVVEGWEFEQFAQQLLVLFPPVGRFPESPLDLSGTPIPGFMAISAEQIGAIELDRRKPGRVRAVTFSDGTVRRWPQLRLYASFGKDSQVRDLLALGASVDELDSSGGSALLCAIQHAEGTGNREALNLLLSTQHLPETLNARTHRKRLTPLMCAIDLGAPEVVQALLEQGADADLAALTDNQSPLYYVVSKLFGRVQQQAFLQRLMRAFLSSPDQVQRETLRRFGVVSAGVFGSDTTLMQANPGLALQVAGIQVDQHVKRHSVGSLTQIVKLLLAHGAKPNRPHRYPVAGRTPMMLAAESDLPEVLHLMMEHGGEPRQPDAQGQNCLQIADSFGARRAAAYLRSAMQ